MRRAWIAAGIICAVVFLMPVASAQLPPPAPPASLTASDHPWDNGTRVDLSWLLSMDDAALQGYIIRQRVVDSPELVRIAMLPPGSSQFTVTDLRPETSYLFEVIAVAPNGAESAAAGLLTPVTPVMQWFDGTRVWFLLTLLIFCGAVLTFIVMARRGIPLPVRRIPGLGAIDEAVGRATEMGRSCLFSIGIQDINDIQTIAGINVLSRVARTVAEYDSRITVPTTRSLVMTAARETVEAAFLAAGRPEAYNADQIYYVTDEQFGYVAHVQGMMVREKPAACFYMGSFFAESLILAETGNRIGAIQVAGTAQLTQLPFFVAACDYTLIGEEFFAASAYLSGEPDQLGSLKGQDLGKIIVAAGILAGVAGATFASITGSERIQSLVDFFTQTMLN